MSEVRTRVIYDYGRWDFEQELQSLGVRPPTDEEWQNLQAGMQFAINESADAIVRDTITDHINRSK